MNKEQRKDLLKRFNDSNQAEAVLEVVEELQDTLKEQGIKDAEDMADVKGKRYAIKVLDRFKRKINVKEEETDKTSYK